MKKLIKRDSQGFGVIIGLILPIIAFGLIYVFNTLIMNLFNLDMFMRMSTIKLLSIVVNVLPIRYYFLVLKYDLTGRGVLLVTFVYVVVYFWLVYQ